MNNHDFDVVGRLLFCFLSRCSSRNPTRQSTASFISGTQLLCVRYRHPPILSSPIHRRRLRKDQEQDTKAFHSKTWKLGQPTL
ncbi:hypothetical protein ASPCADRAFT_211248 [Aspergillus carbonarius ITEM 5010]|uniref:Uncharacterized protein n=1 Tax=Aspergillus carbonarius (strain ITEM 5010) TaxID=602072 RepID=A0A1R3RAE0_ASPC5|nr:hypothetical protein ASPCADRAFT_211248 [Aspergillus carbonarius ITEM 5010]